MKKILVEFTTQANLCENPILVSIGEIEKEDKLSIGEEVYKKITPLAPPPCIMIQPTLSAVVYQRKETTTSTISTLAQSTPILVTIEKSVHDKGEIVGEQRMRYRRLKEHKFKQVR